jgi:glucose-6-phosphate isomerase
MSRTTRDFPAEIARGRRGARPAPTIVATHEKREEQPMSSADLWERYQAGLVVCDEAKLTLDVSRVPFADGYRASMAPRFAEAFTAMEQLEKGAIANPDEKRMVGHYWLRAPELAPDPAIGDAIRETVASIQAFAKKIHEGAVAADNGARFTRALIVGIGGSALGPQLAASALRTAHDPVALFFVDNTDPDGIDRTLGDLGAHLAETLVVITSKSGGTKETRNGMLEVKHAYEKAGLRFARHAVAITGEGSELDKFAKSEGFLTIFPMWDWVGGRTSELSAVGLLPAALQGVAIDQFLAGAKTMDEATRRPSLTENPAAMLALAWHSETGGKGAKDMVILPYKDRLELTSRYLQQLVMESLGKALDLNGKQVDQGIAVYGNKGSTDQHAYVQQLRDGVPNFFATFLEVLRDRGNEPPFFVEEAVTSGDYLLGFLLGTRRALYENGRSSITLTIDDVSPFTLGALIALYERAVGLYASLVGINAYHQPGVEAGKKAAAEVLALQHKVAAAVDATPRSADEIATKAGQPHEAETTFKLLEHLAANGRGITQTGGRHPKLARFATA